MISINLDRHDVSLWFMFIYLLLQFLNRVNKDIYRSGISFHRSGMSFGEIFAKWLPKYEISKLTFSFPGSECLSLAQI